VTFEGASTLSNVTLGVGNTTLTVGTGGTYLISWSVTSPGSSGTLAVTINGIQHVLLKSGLGGGSAKYVGTQAIVTLAANDVLTLRNMSTTTFSVSQNGNGGGGNSAALTLMKIQ
jgi:hypothetical protein